VAGTSAGLRTFRVDRVTGVVPTGDRAEHPEGFRLSDAWRLISDDVDRQRTPLTVEATTTAEHVELIRMVLGGRVQVGTPDGDGRIPLRIRGHSSRAIAGGIAGLDAAIEVLAPREVREQLAQIASELAHVYGKAPATAPPPPPPPPPVGDGR